ncbi:hypothetical protein [Terrimonas pollutisoli]|uniref:hypothetical protein n=1 Tax=Terrimonas pollutisoli TaxID=3034147 RepID=UPI0023EA9494|nr:hypothetical protein [Terrimonas sp. H1YJ31]
MRPKPVSMWVLVTILSIASAAQKPAPFKNRKLHTVSIAFTNSQPSMPFSKLTKLVTGNYHPGIELSTGFNWKTRPKHDWTQTFSFGYSYHRWVQHSITLYTELGYRYKLPAGFSIESKLGGGYMRAIVATQTFSDGIEDSKQYSKISSGRSQATASLCFGIGKKFNSLSGCTLFLHYQQRVQTPFIHSYVPLLPYNIMKAGLAIPLKNKNN